jgi:hypothetical protein
VKNRTTPAKQTSPKAMRNNAAEEPSTGVLPAKAGFSENRYVMADALTERLLV